MDILATLGLWVTAMLKNVDFKTNTLIHGLGEDVTAIQTHDPIFEAGQSVAKHVTSQSRRAPRSYKQMNKKTSKV